MQKEMTRNELWQSLFDRVARHLLRQNAKSINIYTGAVRLFGTVQRSAIMGHSPHGNLSAIGSLLTGVDYSESTDPHAAKVDLRLVNAVLEGLGRPQLVHLTDRIELEDGYSSGFDFRAFLIELEEIHDTKPVVQWPLALNNFALRWLLKTDVLIENKEDLPESVSQAVDNLPLEGRNVKFKVPMADVVATTPTKPVSIQDKVVGLTAKLKDLIGQLGEEDKAALGAALEETEMELTLALSGANTPSRYWIDDGEDTIQWHDSLAPIIREAVLGGCGNGAVLRIQCAQLRPTLTVTVHEAALQMRCDIAHDKEVA